MNKHIKNISKGIRNQLYFYQDDFEQEITHIIYENGINI